MQGVLELLIKKIVWSVTQELSGLLKFNVIFECLRRLPQDDYFSKVVDDFKNQKKKKPFAFELQFLLKKVIYYLILKSFS